MPHHTSHSSGTFCWVDLSSPDVPGAMDFYTALFGWRFSEPDPSLGGYANASLDGAMTAGLVGLMAEGQPSAWVPYLATDDADAAASRIGDHGGQVMAGPMDVGEAPRLGRMIVATDPAGAVVGVWQPGEHRGLGVTEEPGSPGWFELWSREHARADEFYTAVFGFAPMPTADDEGPEAYTVLTQNGVMTAGTTALPPEAPAEQPSHWLVYFVVADTDETLTTATARGARVLRPAEDSPHGRLAVLEDPWGARFAVITSMAPPPE